jgi:uncharacterized protein YggE
MKQCILAVTMVLLLLPGLGMASGIPAFPFVFVTGQAEKEVPPDIATVNFGVQVFDEDPAKALSLVEERSNELMALFNKYGIDRKDVVAFEINKETVRERKDYVALRILGYELTRRVTVTVRKLDKFDALMTQLIGLRNITNVRTVFDTTQRKDIETDLFRQAAQKARQQAELLAKGFGSEIVSVHAISVSPFGFGVIDEVFGIGSQYGAYSAAAKAESMERKAINVLVPSTIKLQEAVNAIYTLK